MAKTISFIGDVMLGRVIGKKYNQHPYPIVSKYLRDKARNADWVIANLESPVAKIADTEGDHLQFRGNPDTLNELKWIDAFSLSNNHINDCGTAGMNETVEILERHGFLHNGLFKDSYEPLLLDDGKEKIAVVTVTDMMNIPFQDGCDWDILRVGEQRVMDIIHEYHNQGYFVILFAHIGILFSRYPNPVTYEYLHQCVDYGADLIVTAHSHCLGCMEYYKGTPIFHSLGDFVMDGNSFRRRRSGMLQITIEDHAVKSWEIIPAEIGMDCITDKPTSTLAETMLQGFKEVSDNLARHSADYDNFFKWQYKKEMLQHTLSTLHFLVKSRGIVGMLKMVFQRFEEVGRMLKWVAKDRSRDQRDDDAIRADRKKFTEEELFD